jgi:tRNA threonylcarbamoyladenosine biosynthesis protein TsaB
MISLYINTTDTIELGLLDEDFSWISYENTGVNKASEVLHPLIYDLLKDNNYTLKDVAKVFTVAGPGSYTGLRLGEGFAQTLTLTGIEHLSFYLTDVFSLLSLKNIVFYSNAFKGETYLYEVTSSSEKVTERLDKNFKVEDYKKKKIYSLAGCVKSEKVSQLIQKNEKVIFTALSKQKMKRDVFYYRSLEQEFSK